MFCSQCGARASDAARFCSKCGTALAIAPGTAPSEPPQLATSPAQSLAFGAPVDRWWGPFEGKRPFPSGYEWLQQRNTLLVCRNHLVLLQGDEKRSAALDVIQAMGFIGVLVGAFRNLVDVVSSKKFEFSSELASRLFDDKLMVWCQKSDAVVWRYHEKPWMFIKSSSEQLYCKFNSQAGVLHACFILWSPAIYSGRAVGNIEGIGCQIVDVGHNIPENKISEAMLKSRMSLPD